MITKEQALEALESLEGSAWGDEPFIHSAAPLIRAYIEQAEPAGFVRVPVEPTPEMLAAADASDREYTLRNFGSNSPLVMQGPYDHWCAMIAAAPKEPTK